MPDDVRSPLLDRLLSLSICKLPIRKEAELINAQIEKLISHKGRLAVGGAPEGYQPFVLADMARLEGDRLVYIARDASRHGHAQYAGFFAPDIPTALFTGLGLLAL